MKITKEQLKQIIKEEISEILNEEPYDRYRDRYGRRGRSSYLEKERRRQRQIATGKREYAAGRADFEAGKDMDDDPKRHGQYKTGYMDAKAEAEMAAASD